MMLVFVYGTLKRAHYNHKCLQESEFIGKARSRDSYPMVCSNGIYPYLIEKPGEGHNIRGEVYRIDPGVLRILDRLEGYPDYYYREEIMVSLESHETLLALTYFFNIEQQRFEYREYPFFSCFEPRNTVHTCP